MTRTLGMAVILLLAGVSCKLDSNDFSRSEDRPELAPPERTPPEATSEGAQQLYQGLYADEVADGAHPLGQRARMLVWMHHVGLTEEQVRELEALRARVVADMAADTQAIGEAGSREASLLMPVYADVIRAYTAGSPPSDETVAQLGARLEGARAAVRAEEDPRKERYLRVRATLNAVTSWVESLDSKQRARLGNSRFFLRKRLGPLVNPGDYEAVIGTLWDAGDFNSLRYASLDPEREAMDLGGLWSAENVRTEANDHLGKLQLAALTTMALLEPGLDQAIEVRLGEREALDFAEAEALEAP